MAIAHFEYLVDRCRSDWTVIFCGRPHGAYSSRRSAMEAAVQDAARVCRLGHDVHVTARLRNGRLRVIWRYDEGHDRLAASTRKSARATVADPSPRQDLRERPKALALSATAEPDRSAMTSALRDGKALGCGALKRAATTGRTANEAWRGPFARGGRR